MRNALCPLPRTRRAQRGAFLLEALIGILIFSLGILGLVGLQARAMQFTSDNQFRGEAVYLASSLIAGMWADDPAKLATLYGSGGGGTGYAAFKQRVNESIPGSTCSTCDPTVIVSPGVSNNSFDVAVTISWKTPGDKGGDPPHKFSTVATISSN